VLIVALWLGGMGFLVKREYFRPSAQLLAEAAARVGPGASYYTLSMGGGPIGYSTSTIDTTPAGVTLQSNTTLDIQALGNAQRVGMTLVVNLTRALHLISFEGQLNSEAAKFKASGRVDGDTVLNVEIDAGGTRPSHQRIPLARPLVLAEMVSLRLAVGGNLQPGKTYTIRTFDPMLMQERETAIAVLAESTYVVADSARFDSTAQRWVAVRWDSTKVFKISQTYNGVSAESWIDEQGGIISATTESGFRMERTAFEIAVENWRLARESGAGVAAGAGNDIISTTAIAANVPLHPDALRILQVRLGNVRLSGFDLTGGRQRLSGDTLTIARERGFGEGPSGERPSAFDARLPLVGTGDSAVAAALQPEALVQSDDPRIQAQARQIIGRERNAGRVAELLTRWVYSTLEKKITVSVPSAAQVLESRSGDCNEHTVLYVALARAAGLPARTAAGVVYLRGHFYYHAWPEVWLGQWVAVDPTFGQFPADAAHLRFTIGGLARQMELIRLIGRLQLTVVHSE
jgi:hypothetical protein